MYDSLGRTAYRNFISQEQKHSRGTRFHRYVHNTPSTLVERDLRSPGGDTWHDAIPRPFPSLSRDANNTLYERPTTPAQSTSLITSAKSSAPAMRVPVNKHEGALSERIVQEMSQIRAELAHMRSTRAHRPSGSRLTVDTELPTTYDVIQDVSQRGFAQSYD